MSLDVLEGALQRLQSDVLMRYFDDVEAIVAASATADAHPEAYRQRYVAATLAQMRQPPYPLHHSGSPAADRDPK